VDFSSKPRSGDSGDTLADEKRMIKIPGNLGGVLVDFGHSRMQAGYKLRGAESCPPVRVLLQYRAYPSLPITSARNPALRPLRGLAHGLPYPAHFGADSHDVTCRRK